MISLHKYFMIAGIIQCTVGGVIEILYWVIFSKLVWILLIYPPPPMYYFVQVMPFLGLLITRRTRMSNDIYVALFTGRFGTPS